MQFNRQPFNRSPFNVNGEPGATDTPKNACHQTVRSIHARATITYSAPDIDEGMTITMIGAADGTSKYDVIDGKIGNEYPCFSLRTDDGTDEGTPICTLDGSYHPMPDDSVGFWSTTMSDESGAIEPGYLAYLSFDVARPVYDLSLYGTDKFNVNPTTQECSQNYPVDFTITLYNAAGEVLLEYPVEGNTTWNWTHPLDSEIAGVKAMGFVITKISQAYSPLVVTEFFSSYSETYTDEDILYLSLLEERDYQGGTIPLGNVSSNELVLRLRNDDNRFSVDNEGSYLYGMIKKNRKIEVELGVEVPFGGSTVWYPAGTYYSMDWSVPQDEVYAEVIGFDLLERMRTSEFYTEEIYTDESLTDLAKAVLDDFGIDTTDTSLYSIHADLDDIDIPYAYFGRTTHRDALVEIAEAGMCCLYMDRTGKLVIDRYDDTDTTSKYVLTASRYFSKDSPLNFSEMCNYVEITPRPRTKAASLTPVYTDTESFTVAAGTTVTKTCIFSGSDPVSDVGTVAAPPTTTGSYFTTSGSGTIHIDTQTNYSWASEIVFHNDTGSDADVTKIVIEGKPLTLEGGAAAVAEDESSVRLNGKMALQSPIENDLIQTTEYAQTLAEGILAVYKDPRRDVTVQARGYIMSQLGERMTVGTIDGQYSKDYTIVRQRIEYDGGLQVEMTGMAIAE